MFTFTIDTYITGFLAVFESLAAFSTADSVSELCF